MDPNSTVFVLGPFVDNVFELTLPDAGQAPSGPVRQQVVFGATATEPGGKVNLALVPPATPDDVPPINVYAFFTPMDDVPAPADRTPDWFFKSGSPSGSAHVGSAAADGTFQVVVPGIKPSLTPYHVQTVIEYGR